MRGAWDEDDGLAPGERVVGQRQLPGQVQAVVVELMTKPSGRLADKRAALEMDGWTVETAPVGFVDRMAFKSPPGITASEARARFRAAGKRAAPAKPNGWTPPVNARS
jgi:hypothetical protein